MNQPSTQGFTQRSTLWLTLAASAGAMLAACSAFSSPAAQSKEASASTTNTNPLTIANGVRFAARGLVVISDADMAATAYGDAVLHRTPGVVDTLTLLDTQNAPKKAGSMSVTNSVIGWPEVLDVSPDGRFAYVAETRGVPPADVQKYTQVFNDFPAGKWLTVVDVSQLDAPRQVQQIELGKNLGAARVSRDGKQLASVSDTAGKELVLATLEQGLVKHVDHFALDVRRDSKSRQGARSVAWHPSGDVLAVNVADREVQFIGIVRASDGRPTAVKLLGKPVVVGQTLSSGHFSRNGKFFLTPDVGWGDNAKATDFLFNGAGRLVVVAFDAAGQHRVASQTEVGLSPESIALSNDGKLLVTVNMNRTYLPDSFPASIWPKRQQSSLSLARFDESTGQLTVLQEVPFDGVLPENAVFDMHDKTLAVAIYEQRGDPRRQGQVEFWTIDSSSGTPSLKPTGQRITVTRGAHDLAVLR
jgi:DNA-binding beta-propeller fold protein YncE